MNQPTSKPLQRGFSAIELMTVLAASAIIATLAVSSYSKQTRKTRRADATIHLAALVQQEEMFYTRNRAYTSVIEGGTGCVGAGCGLNQSSKLSPEGYYVITAEADATSYTLTATAQDRQYDDKDCRSFSIDSAGIRDARSSNGADTTDLCW